MEKITNTQLIAEFKDDLVLRGRTATTVKQYPLHVAAFAKVIAPTSLLDVNKTHLKQYIAHLRAKKLSRASLEKYTTSISAFYEFLKDDERYEDQVDHNPVLAVRKKYLGDYSNNNTSERRQCISVDQARVLIARVLDVKEKAVLMLLFRTGMRLHELSELDVKNVNFTDNSIFINPTKKRSHNTVFFDDEAASVLNRYLSRRKPKPSDPLFTDRFNKRLSTAAIARIVQKHATSAGLHNPDSDRSQLQDRFTVHCTRHAFTTWMRRAGMDEKFTKQLRGDKGSGDAYDIYNHIDHDELKAAYLVCTQKQKLL